MVRKLSTAVAGVALFGLWATPVLAGEEHHSVIPVDELAWQPGPPSLPSGVELAVLHGDPAEEGPFVLRLRFPADYDVPPHWHSQEEHVTIISGAFGVGAGETFDREAAPLLEAGSFVRMPAEVPHYAWTVEETIVQINGMGPFDIYYVHSEDDPRG